MRSKQLKVYFSSEFMALRISSVFALSIAFSYSFATGANITFIASKNPAAEQQTVRPYFVSCVYSSGGNAGFFGNLVERGFTKAISKKLGICRPDDFVVKRMILICQNSTSLKSITPLLITELL